MFQAFSCRQLTADEQWLDADYQISCHDDDNLFFRTTLALLGIAAFPIGIPVLTLLVLLKADACCRHHDTAGIRVEGSTRTKYEFLVMDYKPEFYYWECIEPPSRLRPPGTVLGGQEVFAIVNRYGKYALKRMGPDNILGGSNCESRSPSISSSPTAWRRQPGAAPSCYAAIDGHWLPILGDLHSYLAVIAVVLCRNDSVALG